MRFQIFVIVLSLAILVPAVFSLDVYAQSDSKIPSWIKTIIMAWADGTISDAEFTNAIEYLADNNILKISGEGTNEQLINELEYLRAKNNVNKEELNVLRTENEEYRIQILTLKQNMAPNDATGYLSEANKRLQNDLNLLKAENKGYKNLLDSMTAENEAYQNKLNFLEAENEEYKIRINSIKQDKTSEQINQLKLEIGKYQNEVESLQNENAEYKNKINSILSDKKAENEIRKLKTELERSQKELDSLKIENNQYRDKVNSLITDTKVKDEINRLKTSISNYEKEIKSIKNDNTQYQSKLDELSAENSEYQNQINSLTYDNTEYKDKLNSLIAENSSYKNKLSSLEDENAEYKNKIGSLSNKESNNKEAENKITFLRNEIDQYKEKIKLLQTENDEYKNQFESLSIGGTKYQSEIEYLRAKNEVNREELNVLRTENEEYRIKLALNIDGKFKPTSKLKDFSYEKIEEISNGIKSNTPSAPLSSDKPKEKLVSKNVNSYPMLKGIVKTIYVEPLPEWGEQATNSVSDAISFWENTAGIKFSRVEIPENADIVVKRVKTLSGEYDGHTKHRIIEVGVGNTDCNNEWHSFDASSITALTIHEFGHALGLEHNENPDDVMFPIISKGRYAPIEQSYFVKTKQALFVPGCTLRDETPYNYNVKVDGKTHYFDVFVIPSKLQYDNYLKGKKFQYYSDDGCFALNRLNYGGTCNGVANTGGLLIIIRDNAEQTAATLNVKIQEK